MHINIHASLHVMIYTEDYSCNYDTILDNIAAYTDALLHITLCSPTSDHRHYICRELCKTVDSDNCWCINSDREYITCDQARSYKESMLCYEEYDSNYRYRSISRKYYTIIEAHHTTPLFEKMLPFFDIIIMPSHRTLSSSIHALGISIIYNTIDFVQEKNIPFTNSQDEPLLYNNACLHPLHPRTYTVYRLQDLPCVIKTIIAERKQKKLYARKQLPAHTAIAEYVASYSTKQQPFVKKTFTFIPPHSSITIGILGYYNHGKTSLAAALTHAEQIYIAAQDHHIDTCNNFTERVIRIPLEIDTKNIIFLDCPGHPTVSNIAENAIQTMDYIVLVVSVPDGIMEQTKQHLRIAQQLHIPIIGIFLNKIDMVTDPLLHDIALEEIHAMLTDCGYTAADVPIVQGSAVALCNNDSTTVSHNAAQQLLCIIKQSL